MNWESISITDLKNLCRDCLLAMAMLMTGCGVDSMKWTEEVLLPDGRKVLVSRYQEFGGNYEPGQSPTASDHWLEFTNPDTGEKVRYDGSKFFAIEGMFVHEKVPYIVVSPHLGGSGSWEGCPIPSYVFAKYEKGSWHRISFAESPVKKFEKNMIVNTKGLRRTLNPDGGIVSSEQIRKIVNSPGNIVHLGKNIDIAGLNEPKLNCPNEKTSPPIPVERTKS